MAYVIQHKDTGCYLSGAWHDYDETENFISTEAEDNLYEAFLFAGLVEADIIRSYMKVVCGLEVELIEVTSEQMSEIQKEREKHETPF